MAHSTSQRPAENEYPSYFKGYVDLVKTNDIVQYLTEAKKNTLAFLNSIPTGKWDFRYAEGKWSLKEAWIHLIDSERVFAYRILRISRNDQTPLSGFQQDNYIPYYNATNRTATSIVEEYAAVREATIQLVKNLGKKDFDRVGVASDSPVSVRALSYITGGHEQHHINLTKERYL